MVAAFVLHGLSRVTYGRILHPIPPLTIRRNGTRSPKSDGLRVEIESNLSTINYQVVITSRHDMSLPGVFRDSNMFH
jgi:hypothetical protein